MFSPPGLTLLKTMNQDCRDIITGQSYSPVGARSLGGGGGGGGGGNGG